MPWYVYLLVVLAVLTVPFMVGGYLARKFRMPDHGWKIGLILCSLACGVLLVPPLGKEPKLGIDLSGGTILVYEVDQSQKKPGDPPVDMDRLISAVIRRVNPGGHKEVTVRKYGLEQIEVIIPINPQIDADEAKRIESLISRAGTLEFRILASSRTDGELIRRAQPENLDVVTDAEGNPLAWWVPVEEGEEGSFTGEGYSDIARRQKQVGDRTVTEILVLKDPYDVTGRYLEQATPGVDERGQDCVEFRFNRAGGRFFGGLTGDNLPDPVQPNLTRKLGIILDGRLYSAPAIKSTIYRFGEITGSFTKQEVRDLVEVLNAGSLPTALTKEPLSRLETGPRLGQDTIDRGKWAIGASMILVLLFVLYYYRFAGVVACGALLMNLLLIMAIMISINAAFTLPGLAGLVLTVGMAVDANVLIFERIREELARGAALRMAIRNGFGRATTTVVDANVTTLITGVVLYKIGTDQVRGFAVTLILGVTLSMYTAIFCSRVVFDIAERRRWITKLNMMRILGSTKIDFLGKRRLAAAVSIALIVAGLLGVGLRRKGLLDIDFTGGVSVEVLFKPDHAKDVADVRRRLSEFKLPDMAAPLPDLAVADVQLEGEEAGVRFVVNTSQEDIMDKQDPTKAEKTAIEVVQETIRGAFEGELATNRMNFEPLREVPQQATAEKTAKPADADQTRRDLPSDAVLALAGPGPALSAPADSPEAAAPSDDEAANEASDKSPKSTADEPPKATTPKPPTPQPGAEGEGAAETTAADLFAGGTETRLTFDETMPISYETLKGLFAAEFGSKALPPMRATSPDPNYREGDGKSYSTWDVKIKLPEAEARPLIESIQKRLERTPFFPSTNTIGGKVAGSTQTAAVAALVTSLLGIVIYLWIRFQRVVFGLAAVVALVHDVLVTLGMIALSAYVVKLPGANWLLIDPFKIGLPALAAFLTIIGYSLNDTIVVFDRIREVRGKAPRLTDEMVNTSINQTLARTLLTSVTTLIVVVILYFFGGQGIHGFAFALVVGVLVGTYSSIFVASPALLWMSRPTASK